MINLAKGRSGFNRLTFQKQLTIFFLITAVLAMVFVSVIAYFQATTELEKNFTLYTASILNRTKDDIVTKFNMVENTLNFIAADYRLQMMGAPRSPVDQRSLAKLLVDSINLNNYQVSLDNRRVTKNLIDDLIIYGDYAERPTVVIGRRDHFTAYGIEQYLTPELLATARAAEGGVVWSEIFYNPVGARLMENLPSEILREELNQIAVIKWLFDVQTRQSIGYLVASINLSRLSGLIEDIVLGKTGRLYLVDQKQQVLAGSDKNLILRPIPLDERSRAQLAASPVGSIRGKFNNQDSFIHFQEIPTNNWKLVGVIASQEFEAAAGEVRNRILFGGILVLAVFAAVAVIAAGKITRPIENICAFMQKVEKGDLSLRVHETGSIEIEQLSQQLNHMIENLAQLLEKIYQEQIFKRKIALKMLHAQINPHFLYNTLDSISWMVETGRREIAVELLECLSTIFRVTLSGGRDVIRIGEELDHAENYLRIQRIRYQDKLDYVINVDEEIKKHEIVKITLQPLIENAIYHGIKPKPNGRGTVVILGRRVDPDHIQLSVIDDGVGMSSEKLAAVRASLVEPQLNLETEGKGYSLMNINSRIKLYFGPAYGLVYSSKEGVGTRVDILLPT
ncbi:MAG TPA: histidine kinase [Firmicutes bacterium]|uniref:histidine kinase n=1 Tax=Capillibacterium thermochitinicola TaxID=2699427 RepID=A0A8J6HQU0_9FIRM|nr:histidine kinase [Capillibacterium thermochitinicola]MBA2132366.1 histidine kinase [Capillibacterium thermochitinicola]HHW11416.1 histidine kinase [Bacillota bacterium]